jgi:glycine cleavage system transcriptional repressor
MMAAGDIGVDAMHELVITAVGPDRPGLVDAISGRLLALGGNVADARMVNLRGRFALILLAEVPDQVAGQVRGQMDEVGAQTGLTVSVASQIPLPHQPRPGVPYRLRTYAMDQPGIVHRITHLLNQHNVNIEELATHLEPGSVTGTPLFTMDLTMTLPREMRVNALRQELESLCDSLNCDVELEPG